MGFRIKRYTTISKNSLISILNYISLFIKILLIKALDSLHNTPRTVAIHVGIGDSGAYGCRKPDYAVIAYST